MQHRLKAPPGTAGAGVVAAELFAELFLAADNPPAVLRVGFGRETPSAFARNLESKAGGRILVRFAWRTSVMPRTQ